MQWDKKGGIEKELALYFGMVILGTMKTSRKPKDSGLGDNFNKEKSGLSKKELAKIKRQAAANAVMSDADRKVLDLEIEKVSSQIQKLRDRRSELMAEAGYDDEGKDEIQSSSKMFEQMWKVYRMYGGLAKLKEVMKDPREFRAMAKEMMKAEAAMLKMKNQGVGGQTAVFVVLKGLEEGKVKADTSVEIDVEQIQNALDPEMIPKTQITAPI